MEDSELITFAKQGDKRAFDKLVRRHYNKVSSLVGRYVKDQQEALDVTQDTFLKAYKGLESFKEESAFYTWIYTIATNTAKNHLTAKSRRIQCDSGDLSELLDESPLGGVETPENMLQAEELRLSFEKVLDKLPDLLGKALSLRELDGKSYQEIAIIMNCPVGTVRSRISRARETLHNEILNNK